MDELNIFISKAAELPPGSVREGPLKGATFAVKDNIETADLPTTGGTPLFKTYQPKQNASAVARMIDAGARLIGKTNLHELAFGITSNNGHFGPVRNPHNPDHCAGGSSGGTAVAVATGAARIGLATDTGGSARIPAAFCGVYGFRPTTGRYPQDGMMPVSYTRDTIGVMAQSMEDINIADTVISGHSSEPEAPSLKDIRLGVPREFFFDDLHEDVAAGMERVLIELDNAGVTLVECEIKDVASLDEQAGFPIPFYEAVEQWPKFLETHTTYNIDDLIDNLESPDVREIFEKIFRDDPISQEVYEHALNDLRPQLQSNYQAAFDDNNLDALIFPTVPMPAPPIGDDFTTVHNGKEVPVFPTVSRNTGPGSLVGIPGLSLPMGKAANGLPIAFELDGPTNSDVHLLAIGSAIAGLINPG